MEKAAKEIRGSNNNKEETEADQAEVGGARKRAMERVGWG